MSDISANRLTLCHGTMITTPPPAFIDAAAAAGFHRVSLRVAVPGSAAIQTQGTAGAVSAANVQDYGLVGNTPMRRQVKDALANAGVQLAEAESAFFRPETRAADFASFVESAAYLGAKNIITLFFGHDDEARIVAQFAELAALAADHGLGCFLEFIPLSAVKSAAAASRIVSASGAENGKIVVDALHLVRSGSSAADMRAMPSRMIGTIQLSDGPMELRDTDGAWWQEMAGTRGFPGTGAFPLKEIVDAAPAEAGIGIEVISRDFHLSDLSARQKAQFVMENARKYFGANLTQP